MPQLIAIVDDDYSVRRGLTRLLATEGYAVETFDSGESFLRSCLGHVPSCAILDIHLGGLSGPEVGKELERIGQRVPIILMTAHGESATREMLTELPAVPCLRKPFSGTYLIETIKRTIGNAVSSQE